MSSVKSLAFVGAIAVLSTQAARAADMGAPPPMPVPEFGGWYLRGDIGMTNQSVDDLFNALYDTPGVSVTNVNKGFDSGILAGVGVGYQFNAWFRGDLTTEYRGKTRFRGLDIYSPEPASPTGIGTDDYYAYKSEWLTLANVYLDLGTWWAFTPFIGAGVGVSRNTISDFRDINVPTQGVAFGLDASKWNFAWAAHAGIAYQVTPSFIVEIAYRYVNLGDGQSGDIVTYTGTNAIYNPMQFQTITSQDVKFGIRWLLDIPEPPPPFVPPVVGKG